MKTRKLMKFNNHDYGYFVDGLLIKRGPLVVTRLFMERDGLYNITFATNVMNSTGDDIADFGIKGGFILTQTFEKSDLGFQPIREA